MSPHKDPSAKRPLVESLAIPLGLVMLVFCAISTFALSGPGWVHLLLTLGVFFVIWGMVERGSRK
jgi:hypothetical protein